ncbi:MAG TPA: hypothetical protein VFZ16_21140 [Hyphomicrobiaceae bacterium]|nr:hypothetical protein [Hyphomicrobiaceae bacterium]
MGVTKYEMRPDGTPALGRRGHRPVHRRQTGQAEGIKHIIGRWPIFASGNFRRRQADPGVHRSLQRRCFMADASAGLIMTCLFDLRRLANPGIGRWASDSGLGYTYFDR